MEELEGKATPFKALEERTTAHRGETGHAVIDDRYDGHDASELY